MEKEIYKIGSIPFDLQGCVKMTKENLGRSYPQLSEKGVNNVWDELQKVLIEKNYKKAPKVKTPKE
jgi:hypothetical protein